MRFVLVPPWGTSAVGPDGLLWRAGGVLGAGAVPFDLVVGVSLLLA